MKKYNPFVGTYPDEQYLTVPCGTQKILVHDGRTDMMPFLHDLTLAWHDDKLYVAWYNSTSAEICGSSLIRGRYSSDGGKTWSDPYCVVGTLEENEQHFVPADFLPQNDRLYALITTMSGKNMTVDLQLYGQRNDPSALWENLGKVSEGFLCNTTPQRLENGCWIVGVWMPKKEEQPAFPAILISDGENITHPWRCVFLFDPLHPLAPHIRCPEITLNVSGSCVTAYVRNDEGASYVFISNDYGENWSEPMENTMPIGNSKIFGGTLSDGRPYLIFNQERGYFVRTLLVLAVGNHKTGKFERVYKVFEGHDEAFDRGRTWFYPAACEHDGQLYIGATLQETNNIRSAVIAKIPIMSL